MRWPAAASRTARPRPCGPVPPSTPTTRSSTARPSDTLPPPPAPDRPGTLRPIMPGPAGGPLTWGRRRSVVLPLAVLGGELLLALAHRLQGVLRLLPGLVRTQPVALGAAVARLDGVVLETEEPGPSGHQQPPRAVGS